VLVHQIESGLHRRQGKALTNFKATLPALQSELAQQVLKDPYNFDFLTPSQRMLAKGIWNQASWNTSGNFSLSLEWASRL
jgi:predicted nuclease of restriction endonuclease-like (RecB) superfamily